jgi:hypothetical protein
MRGKKVARMSLGGRRSWSYPVIRRSSFTARLSGYGIGNPDALLRRISEYPIYVHIA